MAENRVPAIARGIPSKPRPILKAAKVERQRDGEDEDEDEEVVVVGGENESRRPQSKARNVGTQDTTASNSHGLTWDEANIREHDAERGQTMKITEPKTPFVRYNAETDQVMDVDSIPGLNLGRKEEDNGEDEWSSKQIPTKFSNDSTSEVGTPSSTAVQPPHSSRQPFSLDAGDRIKGEREGRQGRASSSSQEGSSLSMKPSSPSLRRTSSTSHSPGPRRVEVLDSPTIDHDEPDFIEKHAAFEQSRARHYSNEAEAMKRAQALLDDDEEDDDDKGKKKGKHDVVMDANPTSDDEEDVEYREVKARLRRASEIARQQALELAANPQGGEGAGETMEIS